jgi:hypothetical protein
MRSRLNTGRNEDSSPAAVVLGADPPQLGCCDLLSEIEGSEHTQTYHIQNSLGFVHLAGFHLLVRYLSDQFSYLNGCDGKFGHIQLGAAAELKP